jgi:hypothetical protein
VAAGLSRAMMPPKGSYLALMVGLLLIKIDAILVTKLAIILANSLNPD